MPAYDFPLSSGVRLPQDCGYVILAALSRTHPWLHGARSVQIAPVRGTRCEDPAYIRTDEHSILHIRGITEEQVESLSDSWVNAFSSFLGVGRGRARTLHPSTYLASRLVIPPSYPGPDDENTRRTFSDWLRSFLTPEVQIRAGRYRALSLKGRKYLGFSVHLDGLPEDLSMRVQERGVGKHTSMGCGVFYSRRQPS